MFLHEGSSIWLLSGGCELWHPAQEHRTERCRFSGLTAEAASDPCAGTLLCSLETGDKGMSHVLVGDRARGFEISSYYSEWHAT